MQKRIRQGCSLSPLLFNVYIGQVVKEIKEEFGKGIKTQGEKIKALRFTDDNVILSESAEDLDTLLNGMDSLGEGVQDENK